MNTKTDPRQNHFLAMLPEEEYERLRDGLERVRLVVGDILYEPHKKSRYVYFPVDSTLSLYYPMDHGTSAEIALIGNEGMFSVAPFLGGATLPYMAMVETAGLAYRLDVRLLKQEFDRDGQLRHILLLYTQALFTQMAQISICGRHHSLRQQLCLHLLLLDDRSPSGRFALTQQAVAHMLGVRRESVSKVSSCLREERLIEYRRGQISVLDRPGLQRECCECYEVVSKEFGRLLG
jgi:CRP-like cAMP-binding protein